MNTTSEIRALIDDLTKAVRAKDAEALAAHYAPDVLAFDVITPLQYKGSAALKERMSQWFSSYQGPMVYEVRDLDITASDEIAFCHSLNHVIGTNTKGDKIDMWWRATVCCRKNNGKWLVTHVHSSVPMDVGSGKAVVDLSPDDRKA